MRRSSASSSSSSPGCWIEPSAMPVHIFSFGSPFRLYLSHEKWPGTAFVPKPPKGASARPAAGGLLPLEAKGSPRNTPTAFPIFHGKARAAGDSSGSQRQPEAHKGLLPLFPIPTLFLR
jgi:hypothetical protein